MYGVWRRLGGRDHGLRSEVERLFERNEAIRVIEGVLFTSVSFLIELPDRRLPSYLPWGWYYAHLEACMAVWFGIVMGPRSKGIAGRAPHSNPHERSPFGLPGIELYTGTVESS